MEDMCPLGAPIMIFDGVCPLCEGFVVFALKRSARIRFASFQSAAGRELAARYGLGNELETMAFIENGLCHLRSDAALRLLRALGAPWSAFYALRVLPRGLRDAAYAFVARNRYRWFGKRRVCLVPAPGVRARFLD
jgi:predicted DCC family thiol-disulfide oxidoreductase YuxK